MSSLPVRGSEDGRFLSVKTRPSLAGIGGRRPARLSIKQHLSCIRYGEVLLLQGTPLLGAAFAAGKLTSNKLTALVVFAVACALLVAHVLLTNDWADIGTDLKDSHKMAAAFATKGISRAQVGYFGVGLLAASLLLFGFLGPRPLALACAIVILSLTYSFGAKAIPLLSSAVHFVGGVLYFLLGCSLFGPLDRRAVLTSLFFAITVTAGHLNHEARDYDGDRLNGIRTNAVALGRGTTFVIGLAVFTLAYGYFVALAAGGVLPRWLATVGLLYPVHLYWSLKTQSQGLCFESIRRLQTRYHALYAIIGFSMLIALAT